MKKYEAPQIQLIKFETEEIMNGSYGGIIPEATPVPTDAPGTGENQGPWA